MKITIIRCPSESKGNSIIAESTVARAVFSHVIRELYIGNQAPSNVKKTSYLEAGPHIYPRNLPGKEGP